MARLFLRLEIRYRDESLEILKPRCFSALKMRLFLPTYKVMASMLMIHSVLGEMKALWNKWRASNKGGMRSQFART